MTTRIEEVILSNLINNEEYCKKVLPFMEEEYFADQTEKDVFGEIKSFVTKYAKLPTQQILKIAFEDRQDLKQSEYDNAIGLIDSLNESEKNQLWLVERSEKFCKDQALYNAVADAVQILDGRNTKLSRDGIPSLLQNALSITFDKTIGHDFFDDADKRYEFYHLKEDRIPFDLEVFNKITKGGIPRKTLSVMLAPTGVGKSLFMTHHAANILRQGKNVLYITLEMSEERIAERIDCNLMDVPLAELEKMSKDEFDRRIAGIHAKTQGRLKIKEYPTSGAHVGHFKALLNDLRTKQNFVPDFIFVDYLNICTSQRYSNAGAHNSYTIVKAIAEELRGMAVEYDVPVFSATQTNRTGWNNTDVELGDTSESAGLPMTVDFMFAGMRTEELDELGQFMIKQLKSRFGDINYFKRFVLGVDLAKFKLYDVEQPTSGLSDAGRTGDNDTGPVTKPAFGRRQERVAADVCTEIDFD